MVAFGRREYILGGTRKCGKWERTLQSFNFLIGCFNKKRRKIPCPLIDHYTFRGFNIIFCFFLLHFLMYLMNVSIGASRGIAYQKSVT